MCGRYASARSVDDLASTFGISGDDIDPLPRPDWNVAPTKDAAVVVRRNDRTVLTTMRWGLVPSWADDPSVGSRMFNARVETAAEKPAFRDAVRTRHCLVPADGWFEWQVLPDGTRQPYFVTGADDAGVAFAGLWEHWRDADGMVLRSMTILTGPAPDELEWLHHRAPVVLPPSAWADWLVADDVASLGPTDARVLVTWPVSTRVGDVQVNGPELVARHEVDTQPPLF
ncbi:MAG: SOS response-associated peptidase [Frankiales bacterium]|nr:SOS response-associated peptidase [Frankiales bacterium]